MLPHPFKLDAFIEGEHSDSANLCNEITMPMSDNGICVLGMKPSMMKYLSLNNDTHQIQVQGRVWHLIGDTTLKAQNAFYSGATPDMLLDDQTVVDLARELYDEHEEDLTELYTALGSLRTIQFEERLKLFGSLAINKTFKEQGIMQETNVQIAKLTQAQEYGTTTEDKKLLGGKGDVGLPGSPGSARRTRKKSKPKSNHIPNMQNKRTKSILGASILNMLGKVQQDTQDAYKRSLLKEIPLADLVEISTGETLPDYQANMLNGWQAKFDPNAPIVTRVNASYEIDDGPLTDEQMDLIRAASPATNTPRENFTKSIFSGVQETFNGSVASDERLEASDKFIEAMYPGTLEREANIGRGLTASVLTFDDDPTHYTNEERQAFYEKNA